MMSTMLWTCILEEGRGGALLLTLLFENECSLEATADSGGIKGIQKMGVSEGLFISNGDVHF